MSWEAVAWAFRMAENLSPAEQAVLSHLASFYRPEGGAFPATKTLARRTNLKARYVRRLLDKLIQKGLISVMAIYPHGRCFDLHFEVEKGVETGGPIVPTPRYHSTDPRYYSTDIYKDDPLTYTIQRTKCSPTQKSQRNRGRKTRTKTGRERINSREFLEGKIIKTEDILKTLPRIENIEQARQKLASQITQKNLPATATPKLLWEYWRDLHAVLYPGVMVPVGTRAAQSMLHKACEQVGPEFIEALPTVLADWPSFTTYLTSMVGGKGAAHPTVTVVARHPAVMVSYVNSLQKTVNPGAIAPQPPKGLTKYAESVDTPLSNEDKAEVLRMMIEFDVDDDGNNTE